MPDLWPELFESPPSITHHICEKYSMLSDQDYRFLDRSRAALWHLSKYEATTRAQALSARHVGRLMLCGLSKSSTDLAAGLRELPAEIIMRIAAYLSPSLLSRYAMIAWTKIYMANPNKLNQYDEDFTAAETLQRIARHMTTSDSPVLVLEIDQGHAARWILCTDGSPPTCLPGRWYWSIESRKIKHFALDAAKHARSWRSLLNVAEAHRLTMTLQDRILDKNFTMIHTYGGLHASGLPRLHILDNTQPLSGITTIFVKSSIVAMHLHHEGAPHTTLVMQHFIESWPTGVVQHWPLHGDYIDEIWRRHRFGGVGQNLIGLAVKTINGHRLLSGPYVDVTKRSEYHFTCVVERRPEYVAVSLPTTGSRSCLRLGTIPADCLTLDILDVPLLDREGADSWWPSTTSEINASHVLQVGLQDNMLRLTVTPAPEVDLPDYYSHSRLHAADYDKFALSFDRYDHDRVRGIMLMNASKSAVLGQWRSGYDTVEHFTMADTVYLHNTIDGEKSCVRRAANPSGAVQLRGYVEWWTAADYDRIEVEQISLDVLKALRDLGHTSVQFSSEALAMLDKL